MRALQVFLPVVMVLGFLVACIKAPRPTICGVIGGVLGVLIPFLLSVAYTSQGGDPTAAGVFSFFCILTLPLGIAIGVFVGIAWQREASRKNNTRGDDET